MRKPCAMPITKGGTAFPTKISTGVIGVINIMSKDPSSRSRETATPARSITCSIESARMSPGMML